MQDSEDLHVGRTALREGLISADQLLECLLEKAEDQRAREGLILPRTLGQILVGRGYLKGEDLRRILARRHRSREETADLEIGRLAVSRGYATREQVAAARAIQKASPGRRLGEILLEQRILTAAQLHEVLSVMQGANYYCPACGSTFNVPYAQPGGRYTCRECGTFLEVFGPDAPVESLSPAAIPETEHALAVYIRQKNMVRKEALREAVQFQEEGFRYGLEVSLLDILERQKQITWQQAEHLRSINLGPVVASEEWRRQVIPGYKIVTKIATGGFATIFAAETFFGGERVALKILRNDRAGDPDSIRHFRHEARLMMLLDHPGIVRAYECGHHQGLHYITMEFVDGRALDQAVQDSGGLSPAAALRVTRQVAEALYYMQREGYLHRDVKPENILLDRRGNAKVCDLGFATEIRTRPLPRPREEILGTAAYVSPEQARGIPDLKVGTDIYSLGLTLYYMLTGHIPFEGENDDVIMADRFAEGVASPDFTRLRGPDSLVSFLRKMLHPRREERYPTYPDLLRAMEGIRL